VLGLRGKGGALGLLYLADDAVECTACQGLNRIHVTLPKKQSAARALLWDISCSLAWR
jgi:hypothetical protein